MNGYSSVTKIGILGIGEHNSGIGFATIESKSRKTGLKGTQEGEKENGSRHQPHFH